MTSGCDVVVPRSRDPPRIREVRPLHVCLLARCGYQKTQIQKASPVPPTHKYENKNMTHHMFWTGVLESAVITIEIVSNELGYRFVETQFLDLLIKNGPTIDVETILAMPTFWVILAFLGHFGHLVIWSFGIFGDAFGSFWHFWSFWVQLW